MLAVGGRSNGGLTAAAVALQRPDLFKVAFPAVGVLDLLRYNLFTYGFSWYYDYGFSSIEPQFNNMFVFSPLQNVQKINYPAMYIQTGQEDTRVPPLHSYKFAATLQNVASGPNPYILDAVPNISHFPATYTQEEAAKTWTFLFYNMNIQLPN
jgi:prolyl oligopeptidase